MSNSIWIKHSIQGESLRFNLVTKGTKFFLQNHDKDCSVIFIDRHGLHFGDSYVTRD